MKELTIDSNERGPLCDAVKRSADRAGITIVRRTLTFGDYGIGSNSVLEAKSINDLFQSSHNGHLWRQLENMDANYDRFFLLVHGTIKGYLREAKMSGRKVNYSRIQSELTGTIARIMADFDCHVLCVTDHSQAAAFVVKLHQKMQKPASRHGARALKQRTASNDVRKDMLLTIPGFGSDLVDKLLDKCGSIEEMCYIESLRGVRGLGNTLRARLHEVLTKEEPVTVTRQVRQSRGTG